MERAATSLSVYVNIRTQLLDIHLLKWNHNRKSLYLIQDNAYLYTNTASYAQLLRNESELICCRHFYTQLTYKHKSIVVFKLTISTVNNTKLTPKKYIDILQRRSTPTIWTPHEYKLPTIYYKALLDFLTPHSIYYSLLIYFFLTYLYAFPALILKSLLDTISGLVIFGFALIPPKQILVYKKSEKLKIHINPKFRRKCESIL